MFKKNAKQTIDTVSIFTCNSFTSSLNILICKLGPTTLEIIIMIIFYIKLIFLFMLKIVIQLILFWLNSPSIYFINFVSCKLILLCKLGYPLAAQHLPSNDCQKSCMCGKSVQLSRSIKLEPSVTNRIFFAQTSLRV